LEKKCKILSEKDFEPLPSEEAIRLNAMFEAAIDGIIIIDDNGLIERVNPAAARIFGYTPSEIIGHNVRILMPSPFRQEHDGYLRNYLSTGVRRIIGIGREVKGLRKDGSIFPMRLAVSEVKLADRTLFTGFIHDITEIKEAQAEIQALNSDLEQRVEERTEKLAEVVNRLIATNKALEREVRERKSVENALRRQEKELQSSLEKENELSELKTRFVSMASHEFRTPLSTILSSVELVEAYVKESQQAKRQKHIDRIKESVNNLNNILNDFLSLSRLEEGRVITEPESFDFNVFCEQVLDEIRLMLKPAQNIHHEGLDEKLIVHLDKKILKNILINLLSNAVKYSPEGSTVYCRVNKGETYLQIDIEDEGIGIPEHDQQHLFTRFFRAHNVENIKGTGLGLNIVRRYLDLLDGNIDFQSELGKGSVFKVSIPLSGLE
jgi:PAS domain S-box-containing protein